MRLMSRRTADNKGGNILIDSNGGTVTNCIIRNATMMGIAPGGGSKTGAGGRVSQAHKGYFRIIV